MYKNAFDRLFLFQNLNPAQKELLQPLFIPVDCYGDTLIFKQGDPADFLYLVVTGEVLITYKPDDGPPITVARVGEGGVVGWSAALGNRRYTSNAVCTVYTQMLRVRGEELRNLCNQYPDIGILILDRLAMIIAERLRSTHEQVITILKQGMLSDT